MTHPTTPVSRLHVPGWRARFEATLERTRTKPVDLVWLGDSIVAQFQRRSPDPSFDYRPIWNAFYEPRRGANFGFSGDTTQNLLWRVENGQVDGIRPRLAIVLIGANNLSVPRWSAPDTLAGIEAVVAALRQRLPQTAVLLLGVLPSLRGARMTEQTAWMNTALAERYDTDPNVTFEDVTGLFRTEGRIDATLFADTYATPPRPALHPSAPAQRRLAEAIEPNVRRLMGEGDLG